MSGHASESTPTVPREVAGTRVFLERSGDTHPVPPGVSFTAGTLGGVPALRATTDGAERITVLFLHGGAYVGGSAHADRALQARLALATGACVWSIDYRLAPEHPAPAALADARSAYEALLADGIRPEQLVLVGESAGGGLALALLLALRDDAVPLPAAAAVMSPYADLTFSGGSMISKATSDPVLRPDLLRTLVPLTVGDLDPASPQISPVFGDYRGLPPLLVQVGSAEVLLDDAVRVARAAAEADVRVVLEVEPGATHVFQNHEGPIGDAALARIALFVVQQERRLAGRFS